MTVINNETNEQCTFMVLGDLNSRIGQLNDFVEFDYIDVHVDILPDDYEPDLPIPRVSKDKFTNQNGNLLIDFCKESGLRILNGRVGLDGSVGKYTFVGTLGNSVVNYVLASQSLFKLCHSFEVKEPNILSDHCVIEFSIITNNMLHNINNNSECKPTERIDFNYKWSSDKKDFYTEAINSDEFKVKLDNLTADLINDSVENIDNNIKCFSSIMDDVCSPLFQRKNKFDFNQKENIDTNKKWFDEECKTARDLFFNNLNMYRKCKTDFNRINMCKARSEYKHIIRKKRFESRKDNTSKLLKARVSNAKE